MTVERTVRQILTVHCKLQRWLVGRFAWFSYLWRLVRSERQLCL